jgi:hypothetical protein
MTNLKSIYTVGQSITTYLTKTFQAEGSAALDITTCDFQLISSNKMQDYKSAIDKIPALTLYLYRVTMNEHLRNTPRLNADSHLDIPLSVDLHYLLTIWADKVQDEHCLLAWAMQQMYLHPVFDSSFLNSDVDWRPEDVVQIFPAELSPEDMMRLWDALEPPYHLSVSYVARVVRIDQARSPDGRPVVASRFNHKNQGGANG